VGLIAQADTGSPQSLTESLPKHPRDLTYPELKFTLPDVNQTVLDNGLVIYLREDHSLPVLDFYAMIRVGAIYDPADKLGLANLTGEVMRTGGTREQTGDQIDEILEFIGASVETSIEQERGIARMGCLSKDLDTVLPIFAEILMRPEFREEKIDLRKKEVLENIRRRNDQPGDIVEREFQRVVYGDHPYGNPIEGEANTIVAIQRQDLVDFHQRYYMPNNIILGVAGDFNTTEMLDCLKEKFGGWERRDVDLPGLPDLLDGNVPEGGVFYFPKDLTQSNIRLGHLGIRRTDEDYIPVRIMNFILGGGSFSSRMMTSVRSDEGLAYNVYSYFEPKRDRGLFIAEAETKTESTLRAISLMKNEIRRICEEPVSEQELTTAKDSYLNRFVFNFTTTRNIVEQRVELEYEGLPEDYLDTFCDKVSKVTQDDILRVAKKWLHPDSLRIVIVGNAENFGGAMSDLGTVREMTLRDYAAEADSARKPR